MDKKKIFDLPIQESLHSNNYSDMKAEILKRIDVDLEETVNMLFDMEEYDMPPMQAYPYNEMSYIHSDEEITKLMYLMTKVSYINHVMKSPLINI